MATALVGTGSPVDDVICEELNAPVIWNRLGRRVSDTDPPPLRNSPKGPCRVDGVKLRAAPGIATPMYQAEEGRQPLIDCFDLFRLDFSEHPLDRLILRLSIDRKWSINANDSFTRPLAPGASGG